VSDSTRTFGVCIPILDNVENLRRCLASVQAVRPELISSTVVVDDSGEGLVANAVRAEFPSVKWIVHEKNMGFGPSASDAVRGCPADIVILLNDDVRMLSDPVPPLAPLFSDRAVFAVTFQSHAADGRVRESAKRLVWQMGLPRILHNARDQLPARAGLYPSAYAVGGHAAYRREFFLELGGFDPLYSPFYWEDVDLSQRARRRGWATLFTPEVRVEHAGHSAHRDHHRESTIRLITTRNRFLFAWRHESAMSRPIHLLTRAMRLIIAAATRDRQMIEAWRLAKARRREFSHTIETARS